MVDYGIPENSDPRVDLHVHSTCSDGLADPAAGVEAAKECGLAAMALTDHDTLAGIEEAAARAVELELPFVPGLEFSAYDDAGSTHILAYYVDPEDRELVEHLSSALESRERRAAKMVEALNRLGMDVTMDEVRTHASEGGLIARPHVARALLDGGWVRSYNEAFSRFLAAGQPAYVPTRRIAPPAAIELIHGAGGLAVLAHGGRTHSEAAIRGLVDAGLDGLEVLHPDHGPYEVQRLRKLADELGLLETGGSDWHGPHDSRRGQLASMPVPYEWYERLREAASARHAR
ncbi:MAG TPA: PHP domain-containing protein [Gemmatimonadota bacterium]|nr:PHP domain-containing protein [Gemmatimonadota bacterium]